MIVRDDGASLLLITQPEHAALSERIMSTWQADGLPHRRTRDTILLATREHDNGWREVDVKPSVNSITGRPHDFINVPDRAKRGIWPRGVARLEANPPQAAALIAQHALTVLERHRTHAWCEFFATIETARDRLLSGCTYSNRFEAFTADYRFVFLGDLLSLIFCCGWQKTFAAEGYEVVMDGRSLTVHPDPFEGQNVQLAVRAHRVPNRHYQSDEDLATELNRSAPEEVLTGVAIGR